MSDNNRSGFSDDPNRGPLDRAANAVTGGSGGLDAALGHDDPNRGPLDRAANAVTGGSGGVDAIGGGTSGVTSMQGGGTVSAMFDSQSDAERAVSELRSAGVDDSSLSVIVRNQGTTTARDGGGDITDEHHENIVRGILGGGALGAGLGVLALAIPGVGPLVAAGAIAASAVPGAVAIGAAAGAAAGTLNETLKGHGVSDEDVQLLRRPPVARWSPGDCQWQCSFRAGPRHSASLWRAQREQPPHGCGLLERPAAMSPAYSTPHGGLDIQRFCSGGQSQSWFNPGGQRCGP